MPEIDVHISQPKGGSCCHLTSNRIRKSHCSGAGASVSKYLWITWPHEVKLHSSIQCCCWQQHWIEECARRERDVFTAVCLCHVIYCWRCRWATNSHCTAHWIDTAAVQSCDLQALLGKRDFWSVGEILLLDTNIILSFSLSALVGVVHELLFKLPVQKTVYQIQFVTSVWIYAAATHLLLCLLKQCSNKITVRILILVEKKTSLQQGRSQ